MSNLNNNASTTTVLTFEDGLTAMALIESGYFTSTQAIKETLAGNAATALFEAKTTQRTIELYRENQAFYAAR